LKELEAQKSGLAEQRAELVATGNTLNESLQQIDAGFVQLRESQLQAEAEFAAAEAKLQIALQLWSGLAAGSYSFLGFSTNALYHIAVKKSTLAFC
jgi:hypothetical protein